jgi:8-oxo-dGTP pyrophosphatase MutT (NUDIX family)
MAGTGPVLASGGQDGPVAAAVLVPLYVPAIDQPGDRGDDQPGGLADDQPRSHAVANANSLQRLRVVLTRRRSDLRNHAGEISFPGGRHDPDDLDLRDTALREAHEEIGLVRADVIPVGELPPVSTFVTNYVIHPFVGLIPPGRRWTVSPREVDQVLDLSLIDVRDARTRTPMQRRGFSFETDAYIVGEHLIWGATARILEHLLKRLAPLLQPSEREL